jgi:hypothetical protein
LLSSTPERVKLTVSPVLDVLEAALSDALLVLAGFAASVRRVEAVSVGLKPCPLIRSVICDLSGAVAPQGAYRPLERRL